MLQDVPPVLRLNPADDVVIARRQLVSGTLVKSEGITVIGLVPPGPKVASRAIAPGQPVRRYNRGGPRLRVREQSFDPGEGDGPERPVLRGGLHRLRG